jgi:hypothetical protein
MEEAITWYLESVIKDLEKINDSYSAAHTEIKTAHDSQAAGWFGGRGNAGIQLMSSSFFNAAEWQMRQLIQDQADLLQSLRDYRAMLLTHVSAARDNEQRVAARFRTIDAELEGQGH